MKNKILLFLTIILINQLAYAKPHIVVSITPIASLVSMLTKGAANVVVLDSASGCPHHHQAKPSDKSTIESAQMVIYIDDDFDGLVPSMLRDYNGKKVKISNFSALNFKGMDGKINWHFWLDLNNVLFLQKQMAAILIRTFPEIKNEVEKNLLDSIDKINTLAQIKQMKLARIQPVAILSDSLEHFFRGVNTDQLRIFQTSNISLKNMKKLDQVLDSNEVRCIILADDQDVNPYRKYNKIIIELSSENWAVSNNSGDLSKLFVSEYNKMIYRMMECK
jgi:zinc transport system substrate-binding protein